MAKFIVKIIKKNNYRNLCIIYYHTTEIAKFKSHKAQSTKHKKFVAFLFKIYSFFNLNYGIVKANKQFHAHCMMPLMIRLVFASEASKY
jgi:hypothetical protein